MDVELYRSELDYKGQHYKPFNGRKNHFCVDCKEYYKKLYQDGITKTEFPFKYKNEKTGKMESSCQYDYRLVAKKIEANRDLFESDEDFEEAKRIADPVTWAYTELGWEPRWYQNEILGCSSQFKAIRAGRRVGKTAAMSVLILWYAITNANFKVLIVCPYMAQVTKIFDNIRELVYKSPDIHNSLNQNTKNPNVISFNNGSIIRGFAMGGASGGKSDQVRGQDADLIAIDEADFIEDADLEVVMAILTSNKLTKIIASSTPRGLRSRLYKWTHDKDENWKEFWYISPEGPQWDDKIERFYKSMYSEGGYAREFLAEFGSEAAGVFKGKDIQISLRDYEYKDCQPDHEKYVYTMGVDWNKITGTHICIVQRNREGVAPEYKLVEKAIIRKQEFTQLAGVQAIVDMDVKWRPEYIYCDAGYGHVQVEQLWSLDIGDPSKEFKRRLKPQDMGSNLLMYDPISKQEIKKPLKPFMVWRAAAEVEQGHVIFPRSEDTTAQIIPEEIEFSNIGVVQQARHFKVEKTSAAGRETFSQEYEHTLTAWMLAILAHHLEYGDYCKRSFTTAIGSAGAIGVPRDILDKIKTKNNGSDINGVVKIGHHDPDELALGYVGKNVVYPGTSSPPKDSWGNGYKTGLILTNVTSTDTQRTKDTSNKWKRTKFIPKRGSRAGKLKYGR